MYLTYLDSNTWLIELADLRILLDPWLVGDLVFGGAPWFFRGFRAAARTIPDNIDLILLSQGLEDHAHIPTLQQLDHSLPVVASPNAAKVVQKLGYTQVTSLNHGETYTVGDRLHIQVFPGSPIGPFLTEHAYLLTDRQTGLRLYYEPHGYHSPTLQQEAPVDVVLTPLINLELPVVGPFIRGQESALTLAEWLKPQVILPTAAGGDVQFDGALATVLKAVGSVAAFQEMLAERGLQTRVVEPIPGDRTFLDLGKPETASSGV